MTYFTFQRVVTFIFGVGILLISYFTVQNDNLIIKYILTTFIFGYGVYIVIAALLPYKKSTQNISDEVLGQLFSRIVFELPLRVIVNFFTH